MFQPVTFHDKRSALNEILLQQMVGLVQGLIPAIHNAATGNRPSEELMQVLTAAQQNSQEMLTNYGIGMSAIRNKEADRVLGPVMRDDNENYADPALVLEYLKANVGRTYFGTSEPTAAPDGSIGTAGFGKKFKDWLNDLPDFDLTLSQQMAAGFYKDTHTNRGGEPMPLLVLRNGQEIIVVAFRKFVSIDVLNLDHVPEDYRWDSHSKYALRGEMYSYRGDLTVGQLESLFLSALTTQGITTVNPPVLKEVTNGLSQVKSEEQLEQAEAEQLAQAETDANVIEGGVYAEDVKSSEQ